jgi:type VI secretion system protein ImpK
MAEKDPFAEPNDSERTVIRPNPGGRRSPSPTPRPDAAAAAQPQETGFGVPAASGASADTPSSISKLETGMTGMNPLNACASTLFSLVSRIGNRAQHMDPEKLRQSVVSEVREFENRALQASIDAQDVKIARYAICATLDDVVLNTPWGGQSIWTQQSMVGTFHRETVGGDRFYDLLARLESEPGKNIDLLEFLYMCMSLGFQGRLRVEQGGADKHLQIRAGLARIIATQRGQVERDLSVHWEGVDKPHRALSVWKPVWITASVVSIILTIAFLSLSFLLSGTTKIVLGQLSVLDRGLVAELVRLAPPPPPPPPSSVRKDGQLERIKQLLEPEIAEGVVSVFQESNTITLRVVGRGMFGSGSDILKDAFLPPLEQVAKALDAETGPIIIAGHSDNVPIKSSRFPSNMHLSLARATSVMKSLSGEISDPGRMSAEGRADKNPIAPNSTREGRAQNRRIEILLVRVGEQ